MRSSDTNELLASFQPIYPPFQDFKKRNTVFFYPSSELLKNSSLHGNFILPCFFFTTNNSQHKHTFFQALTVAPSMHFFYPLCFWKMCWLSPTIDAYLPKGQSIPRELKQIQFYTNSIAINATSPAWLSLGHKAVTMDEAHVIKRHLYIPFSFS